MNDEAQTNPSIDKSEHLEENIIAKRNALYGWYPGGGTWNRLQVDANGVVQTAGGSSASSMNVTIYQGTNPLVVAGNVTIYGNISATGVTTVYQGGAPWLVTGSVQAAQQGAWNITATVGGGSQNATVYQGTAPWTVVGSINPVTATISGGNVGSILSGPNTGQIAVATTAAQLATISTAVFNGILIQAISTNAASVFIGNASVSTTNGFEIMPGGAYPMTPANLNQVYSIGFNTTDRVAWNVM